MTLIFHVNNCNNTLAQVLRYIKTVVDEVIPHAFWGSNANRKVIDERMC
jgi:hypothetical protein